MSDPDIDTLPKHIGIILDGNRRWAKSQGLDSIEGHVKGTENFKRIVQYGFDKGIKYLTSYIFSTENWNRPTREVDFLMKHIAKLANSELKELEEKGARVRILGSREGAPQKVLSALDNAVERTKSNTKGDLIFCFNYGGHQEIADALKKIKTSGVKDEEITPELIRDNLYEPDIPDVDLVIRTSGELRLSNFMLWRAAYSELYFVDKHWPDFTEKDLDDALTDYANRQRRFGK